MPGQTHSGYLNGKTQLGRRQIIFRNCWIPLRGGGGGIFSYDYRNTAPTLVLDIVVEWMYHVCIFKSDCKGSDGAKR